MENSGAGQIRCESTTSSAVEFIDIPQIYEPHRIFENDDTEVSTVHTYDDDTVETTAGNAIETTQEEFEESHIIYPKDEEIT